ncbi:MAG: hypothetical protein AAGA38_13570 [Pseudomonadota bacterium]
MTERSFGRTLKNLLLAVLNATLILIALCLFLAWQTFQSFQAISDSFADRLLDVAPLRDDIQALTKEGAGLRADLQALGNAAQSGSVTVSPVLSARLTSLEERVAETSKRVNRLLDAPEELLISAIDHGAGALTESVTDLVGCTRPAPDRSTALHQPLLPPNRHL